MQKRKKKSKKEEEEEDLTRHNPAKYIEGKVTEERPRQEEEWTRAVQQHDLLRNEVYLFLCFFFFCLTTFEYQQYYVSL
jgi:hypothetical protein